MMTFSQLSYIQQDINFGWIPIPSLETPDILILGPAYRCVLYTWWTHPAVCRVIHSAGSRQSFDVLCVFIMRNWSHLNEPIHTKPNTSYFEFLFEVWTQVSSILNLSLSNCSFKLKNGDQPLNMGIVMKTSQLLEHLINCIRKWVQSQIFQL